MIIQTGMRTDIPAFYSEWLCNRIKEGYVMVRNPYQPQQVTRYTFSPSVVDLIAFCSKNPAPMLSHMDLLKTYGMYWFVTITPYGKEIEPLVPDVEAVIDTFRQLAEITGPDSMGWRYDPIFLNETYTPEVHIQKFTQIAQALEGYTHTCVISFIDLYQKVRRNFPEAQAVPKEKRLSLGKTMIQIAAAHGMKVYPCGEGTELACYGADCNGCMTQETYEKAFWGAAMSFLKVSVERYDEKPSLKNRRKETLPGETGIAISDDMVLLFGNMRGRTFKDVKDTPQFAHFLEQLCETRNLSFSDEARNEQLNLLLKYAAERMSHEQT